MPNLVYYTYGSKLKQQKVDGRKHFENYNLKDLLTN